MKMLIIFKDSFNKLKSRIDAISPQKKKVSFMPTDSRQKGNMRCMPTMRSINDPIEVIEEQLVYEPLNKKACCSCLKYNKAVLGVPEECIFCKTERNTEYKPQTTSSSILNPDAVPFQPGKG